MPIKKYFLYIFFLFFSFFLSFAIFFFFNSPKKALSKTQYNITFITSDSTFLVPVEFFPIILFTSLPVNNSDNVHVVFTPILNIPFFALSFFNYSIHENPFQTDYFFWIDPNLKLFLSPSRRPINLQRLLHPNKFILHLKVNESFPPRPTYVGSSNSPFDGAFFGGHINSIRVILKMYTTFLHNTLTSKRKLDNEEVLLSFAYHKNPDAFILIQHSKFKNKPTQCSRLCI